MVETMRLIFNFTDKHAKQTITDAMTRFHAAHSFDRIHFNIGPESGFRLIDQDLHVTIDKKLIETEFIKIDVLKAILFAELKKHEHATGLDFLDEITVGNRIIKHGLKDEYFLYNLQRIKSYDIKTAEDFLGLCSLYIAFHTHDNHDYNFLKSMIAFSKIDKSIIEKSSDIIDMMHNDFHPSTMAKVASIYNRMKESGTI